MRAFLVACCVALGGCALFEPPPESSGAMLPPELQRVLDDYASAWRTRDAAGLAALFADDRTVVPNACPPVQGRADVQKCYTGSGGDIDLRSLDHRIEDSVAYIIGEYAGKPNTPADGKFVLTLTKGGDRWLIVADMDREYKRLPQ
jgi:ketosteroid isomerase-like protein